MLNEQSLLAQCMGWYISLAVAYNALSLLWSEFTGKAFAPTDPATGVSITVALYCAFLLRESMIPMASVTILVTFVLLVGRFGIVRHAFAFSSTDYLSRVTWLLAISINVFGVAVLVGTIWLIFSYT